MTTAASSCITKAEERVRDMLANCTQFQTWTGTANATEAKTRIYYDSLPLATDLDASPLAYNESLRPFALIYTSLESGFQMQELLGSSGAVVIRFEQDVSTATIRDYEETDRLFKNTVGKIIHSGDTDNPGLWELSITRAYTQLTRITLDSLLRTTEEEYNTYGNAQAAEITVHWGALSYG